MCLNELVANALKHAGESLVYMQKLNEPTVFRFCAIPQVMAIATLSECFNNPRVFASVVKIPRSLRHARPSRRSAGLLFSAHH